jgi:hypothetical protein
MSIMLLISAVVVANALQIRAMFTQNTDVVLYPKKYKYIFHC